VVFCIENHLSRVILSEFVANLHQPRKHGYGTTQEEGFTMKTQLRFSKVILFGLAVTFVALSAAKGVETASAASGVLDGKKFFGPTGEKGKKVDHEDVLSFSDGKFTSSACFPYGFKSGPYTETVEGDSIHFQAVTVSPTHGKMEWKGTLKDGTLDVTYSWTKERWLWTTFREYWFTGSLKK
jgi:hypothetical protein